MNNFTEMKITNAILFLTGKRVFYLTKAKFFCLMFLADKLHLEKYGRNIFGDTYYKFTDGDIRPVSTGKIIDNAFFQALYGDFNDKIFSKSEIEVLGIIADKYKDFAMGKIIDVIRNTPAYINTPINRPVQEETIAEHNKDYISFWNKEIISLNNTLK